MAAVAAAAAGIASSLGAAAIQSGTAIGTNTQNLNFQKDVIQRGESSFTDLGLPRAFFYAGNNLTSPNSLIHLGGQNFYEQSGVNANLPFFSGNSYQQWNHGGTPRTLGRNRATASTGDANTTSGVVTFNGQTVGQRDRVGLGAGRYSAVAPNNVYNNVGVQTQSQTLGTRNAATNTGNNFKIMYPTSNLPNSRWTPIA